MRVGVSIGVAESPEGGGEGGVEGEPDEPPHAVMTVRIIEPASDAIELTEILRLSVRAESGYSSMSGCPSRGVVD